MFTPKDIDKLKTGNDNYLNKFTEPKTKIRILNDEVINGFEYWLDSQGRIVPRDELGGAGSKPVRVRDYTGLTTIEQRNAVKPFSCFIVWNYALGRVQIMQIKQLSILRLLDAQYDNPEWGDITSYDITINKIRTGEERKNVEYSLTPSPKKDLPQEILEAYESTDVNLNALFTNEDPFTTKQGEELDLDDIDLKLNGNTEKEEKGK